ncbi:MAG: hypothetical protein DSM107014_06055 [Gomphosphaeria aponina SAG 52.96 = DSM 107014]|uniref:DUF4399 domain-containing protein n=1 Tax=Gomphosphaeria aponina SAG 52.96 = DSM 107014 TaxID=1521640 RepID=A0A941JLT8_9CHRO|nr:hypothetical protein [Gomphosphaeria aponina SAG 52.96 = DSM 107014]
MRKQILLATASLIILSNWVSAHEGEQHEHATIEITAGQPVPTVDLIVHEDAVKGWNLEVQVTNFQFAPENVNQTSTPTEGHAHLYINGEKITRIYGNWYYLGELAPGQNEITVSLNANGHESLMYNGQMIEAREMIEVK